MHARPPGLFRDAPRVLVSFEFCDEIRSQSTTPDSLDARLIAINTSSIITHLVPGLQVLSATPIRRVPLFQRRTRSEVFRTIQKSMPHSAAFASANSGSLLTLLREWGNTSSVLWLTRDPFSLQSVSLILHVISTKTEQSV